MGADQEPRRRPAVDAEERRRRRHIPDAHDPSKRHAPTMLTTDLALRFDPAYEKISRRFFENPDEFADAFARAWFKLTHRDMGPIARYLGPEVPAEELIWQDPIPAVDHPLIDEQDIAALKAKILASGLTVSQLVSTAPGRRPRPSAAPTSAAAPTARASASRRRRTGRSTSRPSSRRCSQTLEAHPEGVQRLADRRQEGLARRPDRARRLRGDREGREGAGHDVKVPFTPGRTDASQEQTDVESFAVLEPVADGFRNYLSRQAHPGARGGAAGRQGATADADRARR